MPEKTQAMTCLFGSLSLSHALMIGSGDPNDG